MILHRFAEFAAGVFAFTACLQGMATAGPRHQSKPTDRPAISAGGYYGSTVGARTTFADTDCASTGIAILDTIEKGARVKKATRASNGKGEVGMIVYVRGVKGGNGIVWEGGDKSSNAYRFKLFNEDTAPLTRGYGTIRLRDDQIFLLAKEEELLLKLGRKATGRARVHRISEAEFLTAPDMLTGNFEWPAVAYLEGRGSRDVHIEIDPKVGSTTYAGLTFSTPSVVEILNDGTIAVDGAGILVRDQKGKAWKSRKARLQGRELFAFLP